MEDEDRWKERINNALGWKEIRKSRMDITDSGSTSETEVKYGNGNGQTGRILCGNKAAHPIVLMRDLDYNQTTIQR